MTDPTVRPEDAINIRDSELGNCRRFVSEWRHHVHYVPPWKSWVVWDGRRWLKDEAGQVVELAKQTVQGIYREAAYAETEDERKALAKHALRSESAQKIRAMLELAESEPGVPTTADAFDADPWLLTCANGTLDLRTADLRPPAPRDMITKLLPVPYEPAAPCPRWSAFLLEIMAGNTEMVRFLQKAIGYGLTGLTREQVFFILWGQGANGKSTMLDVINTLLGEYAAIASMDSFMQKEREAISNDIARLHGVRLVSATEAEQQKRLAEALVKSLTGGDKIVARFLHKEFFEFTPRFKIFLGTNYKPVIRGSEHAIWRRIRLVPFTVTIPDARQDKDFKAKLLADESPGILAWAVEGCRLWQQEGLIAPEEIRAAGESYRAEMDVVGSFITERCDIGTALTATASTLYKAYQDWAKTAGERVMSQTALGRALSERGYGHDRTRNGWFWSGLAVRHENGDTASAAREPGEDTPF